MKILLVVNEGSFGKELSNKIIESGYNVKIITIHSKKIDFLSECYGYIKVIKQIDFDVCIYASGETVDVEKMFFLNFMFPSNIFDIVAQKNKKFVYLSSLAVFAGNLSDVITNKSDRKPIDTYGFTKNRLDEYIKNENSQIDTICIYPASFYSGNGRSSIEKFNNFRNRISFLKYISFPGVLSYITRDELINEIIKTIEKKGSGDILMANHKSLKASINLPSLKFPQISLSIFLVLNKLIPIRISLILRMILRGIRYENR